MGMLDANLQFSSAQAITVTAASTFFYDQLTGEKRTTTFDNSSSLPYDWGNSTFFGEDLGVGKGVGIPRIVVSTGVVFASGTSVQIQFRGAPNNTTAQGTGNRSDLVFAVYMQTDTIALALLTANTRIASFDWPMRKAGQPLPRFVDLNYVVAGTFTTGTLTSDVTLGPDDATGTLPQYPSNYTVAA